MEHPAFQKMLALAREQEALDDTVKYVEEHLRLFLRRQERVLICFSKRRADDLGGILEAAVRRVGGIPLFWGPDYRWKALLKQAFSSRATVIVGPPMILLGLTKLARGAETPLFVRNVLLAGYPCLGWMKEGIQRGLDCRIWECYGPWDSPVIGGFSCGRGVGVHIREDVYSVEVVDDAGAPRISGELGTVVLSPNADPSARYPTKERGRLVTAPCPCGCTAPRLMDLGAGKAVEQELAELGAELLCWSSVLDCRIQRGPCGLEVEIVAFPGEKLPKLPTCAKKVVRPWDPERDMPFFIAPGWNYGGNSGESH